MDSRKLIAASLGLLTALSLWFIVIQQSEMLVADFGIYLSKENTLIVSGSDIRNYYLVNHEMTLTSECATRLREGKEYFSGDFTVVIDGEVVLTGLFVPPIVSRSYPSSQVVIVYPSIESSYDSMRIQMGCPWDQPVMIDPREDPRIVLYFEKSGKLVR